MIRSLNTSFCSWEASTWWEESQLCPQGTITAQLFLLSPPVESARAHCFCKKKALVFSLLLAFQKWHYPVPWHLFPLKLSEFCCSLPHSFHHVRRFLFPQTQYKWEFHTSVFQAQILAFFFFFLSPYLLDGWSPLDVYGGNNTLHIIFLFLGVSWCFINIWAGVFRSLKTIQAN